MTPDIDAIKAFLAAAPAKVEWSERYLVANAPVWLASLVEEVERLRTALENDAPLANFRFRHEDGATTEGSDQLADEAERRGLLIDRLHVDYRETIDGLMAERDAALAEVELLKTTTFSENVAVVQKQLVAALAECERLRLLLDSAWDEVKASDTETDAWRACADQLAAELREACALIDADYVGGMLEGSEALAVYERLKGADS